MVPVKNYAKLALGYFLIAALMGLFLRFFFVTAIPANFRYIVHAHSHIALLGWVYLGLSTLIYQVYLPGAKNGKTYKRIFWFTNVTLLGMLSTFPFTGYAILSISFSTLFLFASYFFTWFVLRKTSPENKKSFSFKCIRAAVWYLVLSSLGPWALGGIMATLGSSSMWYKIAIYFYLHFQYNGWFVLALSGLLFSLLEKGDYLISRTHFNTFFVLLNASVLLNFFLSVLWVGPHWSIYLLAAIGAGLQILAFIVFFRIILPPWSGIKTYLPPFSVLLLKLAGFLLVVKILLQLLSSHPYFAALVYNHTDLVIGYLHWVFLGLITITLFALMMIKDLLRVSKAVFWIYLTGFVGSEALIFYKGVATWLGWPLFPDYFKVLVVISALLPLSVLLILANNLVKR